MAIRFRDKTVKRILPGPYPGQRSRWYLSGWAWLISILYHVGIAAAFVLVSFWGSDIEERRSSPRVTVNPIVEPLQLEPAINEIIPEVTRTVEDIPLPELPLPITDLPKATGDEAISIYAEGSLSSGLSGKMAVAKQSHPANFCGVSSNTSRVVFVVDCSGSMLMAFDYVSRELKRTISQLTPGQYFQVIFFSNGHPIEFVPAKLVRAGAAQRRQALEFIDKTHLNNVPNSTAAWQAVVAAVRAAFAAKDFGGKQLQTIYFLTDGEFDHEQLIRAVNRLQSARSKPAIINVIACGNRDNENFLRNLALAYKGAYRFVSDEEMARTGL